MKTSRMMQLATGALVLTALLAVLGVSQASCGNSQREQARLVSCLTASWENHNSNCFLGLCSKTSTFEATNNCSGKTVVKIDLAEATDKTWHLTYDGHSRAGSAAAHVSGIYCCKDLSATGNCSTVSAN